MKPLHLVQITALAFGLAGTLPALSANLPVTWDLTTTSTTKTQTSSGAGNSWKFTNGTSWIKASSYYAAQSSGAPTGNLAKAQTDVYSGGLAVCSNGETCTTAPQHALDNNTRQDYLLLEFDSVYAMNSFKIGWNAFQDYGTNTNRTSYDSDVQMWTGASNLAAGLDLTTACSGTCTASTLASLGFTSTNTKVFNDTTNGTSNAITGLSNSRYLLVSGALASGNNDYFKMSSFTATKVPEPTSIALFALGLLTLTAVGARKRTKH